MALKNDNNIVKDGFNQKQINHIFHYTKKFEVLLNILKNGFLPSYCLEKINDVEYYIPMVSFCNIPLRDVGLYMSYGKYGIGMSLEWTLKNSISPVVYIHENTPFKTFHNKMFFLHFKNMINDIFDNRSFDEMKIREENLDYSRYDENLNEIKEIAISAIQFFKNWETLHNGREVRTYQEREWRYIPELENEKRIITTDDAEFKKLKDDKFRRKPHFFEFGAKIYQIEDIRYVLVKNEIQRKKIIELLNKKFSKEKVIESILSGKLLILTNELIHNDF